MSQKAINRSVIAASLAALSIAGYTQFGKTGWGRADAAVPAPGAQPSQAVIASVPGIAAATDFSGIVERYGPAVVNISVIGKAERTPAANELPELDPDDPFSQFF